MSPTEGKLQIIIYHDEDKKYAIYDEYACFDKEITNINISEKIEKLKVRNQDFVKSFSQPIKIWVVRFG